MFGSKGSATKPAVRSATGGTGTRPARLPSRPRMPHARTPRRQVAAVTALAIAVLVLLVGVVVGAASVIGRVTDDEPSNISEIVNSAATPSTTPSPEPAGCPVSAGDQNSGEGVIAAFEHAYYTLRSADAAIALLTPRRSSLRSRYAIGDQCDAGRNDLLHDGDRRFGRDVRDGADRVPPLR